MSRPAAPDSAAPRRIVDLVRPDHVHRDVYTSPEIFRLEMERLFGRAWLYLAHDSELPAPGDYVVRFMGTQSVVLTRTADGDVRAIVNRCSHRGATLCVADRGRAPRGHQCPYHGWQFAADGELKALPQEAGYPPGFDRAAYAVPRVPRLENYRGFLFGNLDPAAGPLDEFLGHMASSIDDLVDRAPSGTLRCSPYVLRHYYRANWKLTFENLNDTVHPGFAHAASVLAARKVMHAVGGAERLVPTLGMMLANGKPITFFQDSTMVVERHGHSYIGGHMGAQYSGATHGAYVEALTTRHGPVRAAEILDVNRHLTLLYPSSTWHARYQTVRIVRPVRVDLTEVIGYVFRLDGAPEETFRNAIEYCNGANSAASPVIADDLEIYERCDAGNRYGPREWIPMSRGLAESRADAPGRGASPATSEVFIRNQFDAWREYLAGAEA